MTSSGTYAYNPAASDLVLTAYSRIGIRGAQLLTTQHLLTAYQEANLLLVEWSNRQPNLWKEDVQSVAVTAGTATYVLNISTVGVLIAYLTVGTGTTASDRVLGPLSGQDYASLPNKTQTGTPTSFYFERLITPQITLWPVPDSASTYTLNYRRMRQVQDASIKGGATLDTPYRFLDAFTWGLAARLAFHYAPQQLAAVQGEYMKQYNYAAYEDQEDVPYSVVPDMTGYYYS